MFQSTKQLHTVLLATSSKSFRLTHLSWRTSFIKVPIRQPLYLETLTTLCLSGGLETRSIRTIFAKPTSRLESEPEIVWV